VGGGVGGGGGGGFGGMFILIANADDRCVCVIDVCVGGGGWREMCVCVCDTFIMCVCVGRTCVLHTFLCVLQIFFFSNPPAYTDADIDT